MSFSPNETTVGRVLTNNNQYLIPRYQRKYVWKEEQWKNLIEDIILSMTTKVDDSYHFIGSFIFEKQHSGWVVIDGQQRLTSITLLISAISKHFALHGENKLYDGIRKYCTYKNDDGEEIMRIVNDDMTIFSNIVFDYFITPSEDVTLNDYLKKESIDIPSSSKAFIDCYNYFYKYIESVLSEKTPTERTEWLSSLRDAVLNLKAIEISVDKEQEGHIIFEILNSRGLPLEQHELLKNYLFMYYPKSIGSDIAKDKWNQIVSNVEGVSLSSLKRFITHYITHAFGKVAKAKEYETIKNNVSKSDVRAFLDDLLYKSKLYKSFNNAKASSYSGTIKYVLNFLSDNNNYQFRPILLSLFEAYDHKLLSEEKLEKYLLSIKNFLSIYVVVCKEKTNALEKMIYDYAVKLHLDFTKQLMDEFINKLYEKVNKEKFISEFCQLTFTNQQKKHPNIKRNARKEARYILSEYEMFLASIDDCTITKITIEHILPDSTNMDCVCYIGNLLPLVKSLNKNIKDSPVPNKITKYKSSSFRSVAEFIKLYESNNAWDESTIKNRTVSLANIFWKQIWIIR